MKLFFITCILTLGWTLNAQTLESQLNSAYNSFEDKRVDSILVAVNSTYDSLQLNDRISFHKFSAFRAFQNGQTAIVTDHFQQLISLNPAYTLDPVTTSPKLIMMFDKAKIEYLEQQQKRLQELSLQPINTELPWRSLLFPGWEQWRRGAKTKAVVWGTLGIITVTGTFQAILRTASARDDYLNAPDRDAAGRLYKKYNDLYRSQYYWAYGLATIWLANHLDAVFLTPEAQTRVALIPLQENSAGLSVTINF